MLTFIRWLAVTGILAGSLSANSVLSCSYNGGPFVSTGCRSLATFSFTESLDWANAYGSADRNDPNQYAIFDTSNGPWISNPTGNGITVGASFGPGNIGNTSLARYDNFEMVLEGSQWQFALLDGYATYNLSFAKFGAGDNLLTTNNGSGPLELTFSQGISGAMFRVSTPTSGDTVATIAAYAVDHPTLLDTPIMTYTVQATNASGPCYTLFQSPPVPCDQAPYIGVQGGNGNIRSIVITTPDTAGLMIDTLYLDEYVSTGVPEPGTFSIIGAVAVGTMLLRCRYRFGAAKA